MMMETYLRRSSRRVQRLALDPRMRRWGQAALWGGGGFFLSAAAIAAAPQPLVLGLLCAATGRRAVALSLGAMAGYPAFWGLAGGIGVVWSVSGGLLSLLVGRLESSREQPLMVPILAAFLAAVTEVCFWGILGDRTPLAIRGLRVGLALFFALLFTQAAHCRQAITDWLAAGALVLGLAQVRLGPIALGHLAAGAMAAGPFPGAVLAGVGLDLARAAPVSMAASQCLAWLLGQLPWRHRWQSCLAPALGFLGVSLAWGVWEAELLPSLVLGGFLGPLLPGSQAPHRHLPTGAAQVRLEMGANLMARIHRSLADIPAPGVDAQALVEKARDLACSGCSLRKYCRCTFTAALLEHPLDADCRKQARLLPELRRARDQYRLLLSLGQQRQEYRMALQQQYRFLSGYLRNLGSTLPRSSREGKAQFRCVASARSRGKAAANGDTCVAFPGPQCCYYVLLCDGMGTGLGAAQEGYTTAVLLRQLLGAGFPAPDALSTVNSMLLLTGRSAAATVDLAQIHLDTGIAELYKWGAVPSFLMTRAGAEKIGTATCPPGLALGKPRMERRKLSLRRGETLILLSDGLDGEGALAGLTPEAPPGELAAKILERGAAGAEDDATAAVIRLISAAVPPS